MLNFSRPDPELTDREWDAIKTLLDGYAYGARVYDMRTIIGRIRYVLAMECAWRDLPGDEPSYLIVFNHYQRLQWAGVWPQIRAVLNTLERLSNGRAPPGH